MNEPKLNTQEAMHMINQGRVLINGEWVEWN